MPSKPESWSELGNRIDARIPIEPSPSITELCRHYMTARFYAGDEHVMEHGTAVIGCFDMGLLEIQGGYIRTTARGYHRVLAEDGKL